MWLFLTLGVVSKDIKNKTNKQKITDDDGRNVLGLGIFPNLSNGSWFLVMKTV